MNKHSSLLFVLLVLSVPAHSQIPPKEFYKEMLTSSVDHIGSHPDYDFDFTLYDAPTVGNTNSVQQGDTLYSFVIPSQFTLGVAKMGSSNKLAFTSGGQISGTTTSDNKWIITTLTGAILDTSKMQQNPTPGQGFGFRDLAWDGQWLLTADNNQLRRFDTATFTEIVPPIPGPGSLQRGVAWETTNRIWKSNSTANPVDQFDTTGVTLKTLGTPALALYGTAFDRWTSPNRGYLWHSVVLGIGLPLRLSKFDTATGAILQSFEYGTGVGIAAGLDIFVGHPAYPGRVIAALATQGFPNSRCLMIDLGPDSSSISSAEYQRIPGEFELMQNYPNPFNPSTTIRFSVRSAATTTLEVYNLLGQRVAELFNDTVEPGRYHSIRFDGTGLASGVYIYRLQSGTRSDLKKLLLLK